MRRAQVIIGVGLVLLGALLVWQGVRLGVEGQVGPGPGFFALVVGAALIVASLGWIVLAAVAEETALPAVERIGLREALNVGAIIAMLAIFALALRPLGYNLSMLVLLLALSFYFGRDHAVAKLILALSASFGVHEVFERHLKVPLPYSSIPFLRDIGF